MNRFFRSAATRLFAALLAAFVVGSLLSLALRGHSSPVTSALGLAAAPLQGLSMRISQAFQGFGSYFKASKALQAELAQKDAEIAALRESVVDYDNMKKDNELFQKILELKKDNPSFQFQKAAIIGTDAAEYFGTLTLNRGTASGVKVNNPVLIDQYLVGIVTEARLTSCIVKTILNPAVKVSIYNTRTGDKEVSATTAEWAADGLCIIPQLDRATLMHAGDQICTSGIGEIYPRDLIVGTVTDIVDDNITATAVVRPAVDINNLSNVFILIDR